MSADRDTQQLGQPASGRISSYQALRFALAFSGVVMLLLYPISALWPSGWAWHDGAPHDSQYFMMIVGIYATLGVFLVNAARDPRSHLSVIWFAVWSCLVHGAVMAVQSFGHGDHLGHLAGDVPALLLVAVLLTVLLKAAATELDQPVKAEESTAEREG